MSSDVTAGYIVADVERLRRTLEKINDELLRRCGIKIQLLKQQPGKRPSAVIKAGRVMLREIARHAERGDTFAFETTLAGRIYLPKVRVWRGHGYEVKLFFLSLANADEAIFRIAARVKQGGHYVADELVRRRFDAGLKNFLDCYRSEVDYWHWYNNSGARPVLIEEGRNK
jgi:predicted ABC-type ATPase